MFGKTAEAHHFFGKHHNVETRAQMSISAIGNKSHLGCKNTEKTKVQMSAKKKGKNHPNYGKRGKDANGYKGGKKISKSRSHANRNRDLGYTLLMPLPEGEEGHHVTNEFVIGISKTVHNSIGGLRKEHRAKVLEWLKDNDKRKYDLVFDVFAMEHFK